MAITKLNKNEVTKLQSYAKALEDQDRVSDVEFQALFGRSKEQAKNNIALLIRTFVENHR